MNISGILEEFKKYMKQCEARLDEIGLSIMRYPIDHVGYRAENRTDYDIALNIFKKNSKLSIEKIFRDRIFHLFVLKDGFIYKCRSNNKSIHIPYIEFSEPGGSDNYKTGFQHIEFHTNDDMRNIDILKNKSLSKSKHGFWRLKWEDKMVVKFTPTPIMTKMLLEGKSKVFIY